MHGTALQQSLLPLQSCPYSEQLVPVPPLPPVLPPVPLPLVPPEPPVLVPPLPLLPLEPPLPVPPVPPPPVSPPQVPTVEPGARRQMLPGQQSALMVQEAPDFSQTLEPQRKTPSLSGTQGVLLQQSSVEAQVSPGLRQVSPRPLQRGMPSGSSWQTPPLAPRPPQQSARADEMLQLYAW